MVPFWIKRSETLISLVTYYLICTSLDLHPIRKNKKRCIHPWALGPGFPIEYNCMYSVVYMYSVLQNAPFTLLEMACTLMARVGRPTGTHIFEVNIAYSFCNGHSGVQSTRIDVNQG